MIEHFGYGLENRSVVSKNSQKSCSLGNLDKAGPKLRSKAAEASKQKPKRTVDGNKFAIMFLLPDVHRCMA